MARRPTRAARPKRARAMRASARSGGVKVRGKKLTAAQLRAARAESRRSGIGIQAAANRVVNASGRNRGGRARPKNRAGTRGGPNAPSVVVNPGRRR